MKKQSLIILIILITSLGCHRSKNQNTADDSPAQTDSSQLVESRNDSGTLSDTNCARGVAEPIVKKSFFPNSDFKLQPDKISGIETVSFSNHDKLTIRNWGCESYCLTFRFETTRFQQDTTNLQFWFKTAVVLMSEVAHGLDSPVNLDEGTKALNNFIDNDQPNQYANLKLQTEIDFGEGEIREYVAVNKVQKMEDKKYAVEITYVIGPL